MDPKVGDLIRGKAIGLKTNRLHIRIACIDCGKEQWVMIRSGKPQNVRCASCAGKLSAKKRLKYGKDHPCWKGGRQVMTNGYIRATVHPDSKFFRMADTGGRVYEHRLVMAEHLNRCLETYEEVHHKNRDKHDNTVENLELCSKPDHAFNHCDVDRLLKHISYLESIILEYKKIYGEL